MSDQRGRRRSDRVLDDAFVAGLPGLPLEELRHRRATAEQAEADLSYLRRLLQGRIDIVRAEVDRRAGGGEPSVVDHLPEVLAHDPPAPPYGLGRYTRVEPSGLGQVRRRVEQLAADVELSDLASKTDEELRAAAEAFGLAERDVSDERRRAQHVMDRLGAELARRYRDGEASVDSLLRQEQD